MFRRKHTEYEERVTEQGKSKVLIPIVHFTMGEQIGEPAAHV